MGTIRLYERARRDLRSHLLFISKDNLDAAVRLLDAFERACQMLLEMPRMGSPRVSGKKRLRHLRSWPIHGFTNYIIYYRPTRKGIDVLRVPHGAQNINSRFGRP